MFFKLHSQFLRFFNMINVHWFLFAQCQRLSQTNCCTNLSSIDIMHVEERTLVQSDIEIVIDNDENLRDEEKLKTQTKMCFRLRKSYYMSYFSTTIVIFFL